MSTYLYDEALVEKFNNWISSSQLQVFGPSETRRLFETIADLNNDSSIKLPIISISRDMGYEIVDSGNSKRPLSYDGVKLKVNNESFEVINAIPVSLTYQVDVYARLAQEADILMRNLIFNIINFPKLNVTVPDSDNFNHTATVKLASNTISDISNMSERFIEGNLTVLSIVVNIPDAKLWDVRQHRNAEIEIRIDDTYENRNYKCLECGYIYQGYTTPDFCPKCAGKDWERILISN